MILETLIGLFLAVMFGARAVGKGNGVDMFVTKFFFNPLKKVLPPRLSRALEDKLTVWTTFALGVWMTIPAPMFTDKWPVFALIMVFILALLRAGRTEQITHDIEGEAVDLTPGLAPAKEHAEPVVANSDKKVA